MTADNEAMNTPQSIDKSLLSLKKVVTVPYVYRLKYVHAEKSIWQNHVQVMPID